MKRNDAKQMKDWKDIAIIIAMLAVTVELQRSTQFSIVKSWSATLRHCVACHRVRVCTGGQRILIAYGTLKPRDQEK